MSLSIWTLFTYYKSPKVDVLFGAAQGSEFILRGFLELKAYLKAQEWGPQSMGNP